jgi:MFS family permease
MRLPKSVAPLAERNFRMLWIGQGVSSIGDSLVNIALAFATLSVARSASALGLVLAVALVARVISLPIGGVWADRLPRQLVMLASDGIRAAVQAVLAALLITGHAQLWQIALGAGIYGLADGFFTPVAGALIPQTLTAPHLQQANALMGLSRSFAVTGPVADHVGITTTLVAAAVIMAVPCALVVLIPGVRRVKRTPEGTIVLEGAV